MARTRKVIKPRSNAVMSNQLSTATATANAAVDNNRNVHCAVTASGNSSEVAADAHNSGYASAHASASIISSGGRMRQSQWGASRRGSYHNWRGNGWGRGNVADTDDEGSEDEDSVDQNRKEVCAVQNKFDFNKAPENVKLDILLPHIIQLGVLCNHGEDDTLQLFWITIQKEEVSVCAQSFSSI